MINYLSSHPSCAVLLAVYNGSKYIADQLLSIRNQKYVKPTVFISDDGSLDGSLELSINTCIELSLPFFVVSQDNRVFPRSSSGNFYHLLTQSCLVDSDYIALSDQDDVWHPLHLSRAVYVLSKSNYCGYSSSVQSFTGNINSSKILKKDNFRSRYNYIVESPGPGCSFVLPSASFCVISSHVSNNISLISKIKYHDWAIYALSSHYCGSWFVDSFCSLYYRQHSNNVLGDNKSLSAKYRRLILLFGSFYVQQVQLIISLLDLSSVSPFKKFFEVNLAFFLLLHRSILSHKLLAFVSAFFFKIK